MAAAAAFETKLRPLYYSALQHSPEMAVKKLLNCWNALESIGGAILARPMGWAHLGKELRHWSDI